MPFHPRFGAPFRLFWIYAAAVLATSPPLDRQLTVPLCIDPHLSTTAVIAPTTTLHHSPQDNNASFAAEDSRRDAPGSAATGDVLERPHDGVLGV